MGKGFIKVHNTAGDTILVNPDFVCDIKTNFDPTTRMPVVILFFHKGMFAAATETIGQVEEKLKEAGYGIY